jgi:YidC/Oxa1 family membrane protein insertase
MKHKKSLMLVILTMLLLTTTGCGSNNYLKDENNQIVKYSATGQMLQKDILCKPSENTELYDLYAKYDDQLDNRLESLPTCKSFKITSNETKSLWQFLFVKPVAYIIIKLGYLVNNLGLSVILIGLLIRIILMPLQLKSQKQTMNMQKATPEIQKLERKYANKTDQESLMAKSQETMMIYKKYKVSPVLGCVLSFIQLPLFFAFLQALYRIPTIYEEKFLTWNLGMTPYTGITTGHYSYIILLLLIGFSTYFSFKYSMSQSMTTQTPEMKNQMKMMTYVMLIMIVFTSFSLPTAIGLYWIVTYAFISIQTYVFNYINGNTHYQKNKAKKNEIIKKVKVSKVSKEGNKHGKNN